MSTSNIQDVKFCNGDGKEILDITSKTAILFGVCISSDINIKDINVSGIHPQMIHDIVSTRLLSSFKSQFLFCCFNFDVVASFTGNTSWVVDLRNDRIWLIKFEFAPIIYQHTGSVMEGMIDPDKNIFIIKGVKSWCGAAPTSLRFINQQLNVWFNTPTTEACWYRPSEKDVFKFVVELPAWDHAEVQTTPTLQKHQHQQIPDSQEVFRLYKTQYPFIYSMLPDDNNKANEIKAQLKTSLNGNTTNTNTMIIVVPTIETELQIAKAFGSTSGNTFGNPKGNPKKYVRWTCAKYLIDGNVYWVPLTASNC